MIRFATICEVDPAKGLARVKFPDDGIVSAWLPVVVPSAGANKFFHMPTINELVAVAMDERLENGVVIGGIYSKNNAPDGGAADVVRVVFSDGTEVEYSAAASLLKVKISATEFEISADGYKIKRGGETLFAIINDLITALTTHTHTSAAPGSPTTPPIPPASIDFTTIQTRLAQLLLS